MSASKALMKAASGVETGNPWNISTAQWFGEDVNFFSISAQEENPTGVFFKPDGTKMYVSGPGSDSVHEYNLSPAWDVSSASFLQSFDVSSQEAAVAEVFFKPDGTKMYITGSAGDDINEYDLSNAWDVSSASFLQSFDVSSQEISPSGLSFKTDGSKMYVIGTNGDDINEYDLSTAWDISSASYSQNFSVSSQDTAPRGVFFKTDGTKMYVSGSSSQSVLEYDLSTAWDVSSASFLQSFDISSQEISIRGFALKSDGSRMFHIGATSDRVFQYDLSTPYDISSASYQEPTTRYFDVSNEEISPEEVFFKPDGLKMYITGRNSDSVHEYNLSTEWDVSTASFLQSFSVSGQETNPTGLFFKPDGTEMYVIGFSGDEVNQYSLSTAWDISSASFTRNEDVSTEETAPRGVFFKPDGSKMYVIGGAGGDINEYNLSTAWNIGSSSYVQNFSVSSEEAGPNGVFFRSDGSKMYVIGTAGREVNEYDLSTAWDVSSASYLQNFSVSGQVVVPGGVFFKPDGLKMYVIDDISDAIYEYDL